MLKVGAEKDKAFVLFSLFHFHTKVLIDNY